MPLKIAQNKCYIITSLQCCFVRQTTDLVGSGWLHHRRSYFLYNRFGREKGEREREQLLQGMQQPLYHHLVLILNKDMQGNFIYAIDLFLTYKKKQLIL